MHRCFWFTRSVITYIERHYTISVPPFDVIISYKCCKDALLGHKPATELFQADLLTFHKPEAI